MALKKLLQRIGPWFGDGVHWMPARHQFRRRETGSWRPEVLECRVLLTVDAAGMIGDRSSGQILAEPVTSTSGDAGPTPAWNSSLVRMYVAFNPAANDQFLTTHPLEFQNAVQQGYEDKTDGQDGIVVYNQQVPGSGPIYRLYNLERGQHYYTTDLVERDFLISLVPSGSENGHVGWRDEGVEGFALNTAVPGSTAIYRLYNRLSGAHFYTESDVLKDQLLQQTPAAWEQHAELGVTFVVNPAADSTSFTLTLANDTGSHVDDRVTTDPAVTGRVTSTNPIVSILIGLDTAPLSAYSEVLEDLTWDKQLTLSRARLEQAFGAPLTDGTHTMHARLTDFFGQITAAELTFRLVPFDEARPDPEPLALTASLSPESDPDGNGVVLVPQVTVIGQTLPDAHVQMTAASSTETVTREATADSSGHFQFVTNVSPGTNTVRLQARDALGRTIEVERSVQRGDVILDWNSALLNVIRDWTTLSNDPYTNRVVPERPPVAARNLAMVHVAMYDAVNSIERTHRPYHVDLTAPAGTSAVAAAAAAAQRVAAQLYREEDERAVFDAALAESLATVPDGPGKSQGITLGQQVGDAILNWRSTDGSTTRVPYQPGTDPGDWNRTFPDFLPPLLPQWPQVTPFAMTSPSQFRPNPPPALTSAAYAAAVNEVRELGGFTSTVRTAEQTEIALFWADGGGTFTPPGHWNQIAADVSLSQGKSLADNARLFALLNVAMADAGINSWDAKYTYNLWRPIDAIRRGDSDGNDATGADPTWTTLIKTPPFPTYTSGHSTFSGAADAVLTRLLGTNVHFVSTADGHSGFSQRPLADQQIATRSFDSFSQAADEAGRSRILGGIHFQFDNAAGLAAGRAIGSFVVDTFG